MAKRPSAERQAWDQRRYRNGMRRSALRQKRSFPRSRRVLGRGSFYSDSTQRYRGKISERNWRPMRVGP